MSTDQVQLIEGPFPCNTESDAAEYDCLAYKAVVDADDPGMPLDDALKPTNLLLVLRFKKGTPLTNRWVTFHAGGNGGGYSVAFANGGIKPGNYVPAGRYGDDLIRWYNERGYVTLDVIWQCRDASPNEPCFDAPFAGWVPKFTNGSGWFRNTGGAGYVGISSRTRAVIEWAMANNGGYRVGSHGHSAGSGRLMTTLTRYGGEEVFDTVVFDGGPVFVYIPWYCGITDDGDASNGIQTPGPLGPKPADFDIEAYASGFRSNYDNARDADNGEGATPYSNCTDHVWNEGVMMDDSNFFQATDRDFPDVDLAVVFGGKDGTPASPHARLWFHGYSYANETVPALSARSLTVLQGYCDPSSGQTYRANGNTRPCADWTPTYFPTANRVDYDPTLAEVTHSTAASLEGATALFETMLATLDLNPAGDPTSVTDRNQAPTEFVLQQNYPNPFNPSTTIRFSLPQMERVVLKVFDVLGREVAALLDEELPKGSHSVVFDAKNLTSGVYFYRISAGQFTQIRKALLMK